MSEEQKQAQAPAAPAVREGGDSGASAPAAPSGPGGHSGPGGQGSQGGGQGGGRRESGHSAGGGGGRREGGPGGGGGGRREGGPGGPGGSGGPGGPRRGKRQYFRKKKVCKFCVEKMDFIDYKRADILSQFVQERGKILPRRMTGVCSRHQRWLGVAIKRARNIALLPFAGSAAGTQAPRAVEAPKA
ncbi:MAG TPA: 30S ribosomal protein S18 [Candidatus Acidoferrales bacterium]|jgi:small subunit ribosomal protein S18|nr:30S ribosomal protein S18 [Candidatus Acidoferrales bacterium]